MLHTSTSPGSSCDVRARSAMNFTIYNGRGSAQNVKVEVWFECEGGVGCGTAGMISLFGEECGNVLQHGGRAPLPQDRGHHTETVRSPPLRKSDRTKAESHAAWRETRLTQRWTRSPQCTSSLWRCTCTHARFVISSPGVDSWRRRRGEAADQRTWSTAVA